MGQICVDWLWIILAILLIMVFVIIIMILAYDQYKYEHKINCIMYILNVDREKAEEYLRIIKENDRGTKEDKDELSFLWGCDPDDQE